MAVTAVVLDVGETLLDESGYWGEMADRVALLRPVFFALLGAWIARGDHRGLWGEVGPPPYDPQYKPDDFYPDALPCLRRLRAAGYRLGLAANQPEATEF